MSDWLERSDGEIKARIEALEDEQAELRDILRARMVERSPFQVGDVVRSQRGSKVEERIVRRVRPRHNWVEVETSPRKADGAWSKATRTESVAYGGLEKIGHEDLT